MFKKKFKNISNNIQFFCFNKMNSVCFIVIKKLFFFIYHILNFFKKTFIYFNFFKKIVNKLL